MQPLLNNSDLEMPEDQRIADFIFALRGTQRGDVKLGSQAEVLRGRKKTRGADLVTVLLIVDLEAGADATATAN